MSSDTDFESQIQTVAKHPSGQGAQTLEQLYRRSSEQGHSKSFCIAIERALSTNERSALLDAWGYRLDLLPLMGASAPLQTIEREGTHLWRAAVPMSILLGLIWSVLAGGKPPLPFPGQAAKLFWLGWSAVTAVLIMGFFSVAGRVRHRIFELAALAVLALSALSAWMVWERTDVSPFLTAFHLPLITWIVVGAFLTLRLQDRADQRMSFVLKSAETLVTSAIYLAGAGIFGILTLGIFEVLGVRFAEIWINRGVALALGTIPILAIASIYDPNSCPAEQDFSGGPARLMRLITRLLLTPVLGVLAVYVFWFIPRYFWRAFEERAILIVFNASLAAVLLLIVLAVPHLDEEISSFWLRLLKKGISLICAFSLVLNVYSLSAIIGRTFHFGISPNRHAIIGWNVVTLCFLGSIMASQIRSDDSNWTGHFRKAFTRFLPVTALWAVWVLLASPWI